MPRPGDGPSSSAAPSSSAVRTGWRWRAPADAALVALCRRRLRATLGGRLAALAGLAVLAVAAVLVVGLDGAVVRARLVVRATGWAMWAAALPLALTMANDRAARDRRDGIETMVMLRGLSRARLRLAREVAGGSEISWRVVLSAAVLCAAAASFGGTLRALWLLPGLALFAASGALLVGVLVGLVARLARPRGRAVLAAVVLVPWVAAELWSAPLASLPGALGRWLWLLSEAGLRAQGVG